MQLKLADGSTYPHTGRLNFDDFRTRSGTGTIEARAVFSNQKRELLPGQFVRVIILGATRPNAILIPQHAALTGSKGKFVYVVSENGRAEAHPIETGECRGDQFLVTSGLKPGDRIIVSGVLNVQPGMYVKAVPAKKVRHLPLRNRQSNRKA